MLKNNSKNNCLKDGVALFRGFLRTEFSDENIEFWLACEDYKQTNKEAKLMNKAKSIYTEYVAVGSPREVNLEIQLRLFTAEKILNPTIDTFDLAQKRIQSLMEKDSYPRFLESNLFKNLLTNTLPKQQQQQQQNTTQLKNSNTTEIFQMI
jgi:regulator of G-protein signaling